MSTTHPTGIKNGEYGVTEKKKAELDAITLAVLDAQQDVDQFQAIVSSLTQKLNNFQELLATAGSNRDKALSNRNIVDQLVQHTKDLLDHSDIAFNAIVIADGTSKKLAGDLKKLMDQLIYCAELINKLSALVIRKKALNPLIPDELVTMTGQASANANNAVALTLVALQSAFASQSANIQSEAAAALEYDQSKSLYQAMTGRDTHGDKLVATKHNDSKKTGNDWPDSLQGMIYRVYEDAKSMFDQQQTGCDLVTKDLNLAIIELNKAQVKLTSLQSGLDAGNAAALI